ncbi:hypothetical protein HOY34_17240 [Xinfangfangia sp. D13-10-4-6]|uniref:hypothetical protein n=1 Tax=Pseudogemmobacter hezensis TaxID=2737662 RepID=UPI0015556181|nr:hypothetical protein [Pseudogemmobacter hezensis]NPD16940.1 hypothetical protein [Pseudogemmobacter hezensis]
MSAVASLPDAVLDRAAAREVLRSEHATRDQILMACEVLTQSTCWMDLRLASEMRNAVWAGPGAELRPEAQKVAARLAQRMASPAPRRDMAHHLAALKPYRRPSLFYRCVCAVGNAVWMLIRPAFAMRPAGYALTGVALAVLAHVALAAPGKIARTGHEFHKIEEMR